MSKSNSHINISDFDQEMYNLLVKSKTDLVGKVAFTYYYMDKLRYVDEFRKSEKKYPSPSAFKHFHLSVKDDEEVYRQKASDELAAFISVAITREEERAKSKKPKGWLSRFSGNGRK